MLVAKCRKCKKSVCRTDGEFVCFEISGNFVCVAIRGKYEAILCGCGNIVKVYKAVDSAKNR